MKTGSFKTFSDSLHFVHFCITNVIKILYRNELEIDNLGDLLRNKLHLVTVTRIDIKKVFRICPSVKDKKEK